MQEASLTGCRTLNASQPHGLAATCLRHRRLPGTAAAWVPPQGNKGAERGCCSFRSVRHEVAYMQKLRSLARDSEDAQTKCLRGFFSTYCCGQLLLQGSKIPATPFILKRSPSPLKLPNPPNFRSSQTSPLLHLQLRGSCFSEAPKPRGSNGFA